MLSTASYFAGYGVTILADSVIKGKVETGVLKSMKLPYVASTFTYFKLSG